MTVMLLKVLNDDGVIHIFKVPPEEAAEFKAAKDKDEKTDAERKAKKARRHQENQNRKEEVIENPI